MTIPLPLAFSYIVLGWMILCLLALILLQRPYSTRFAVALTLVMIVVFWAWLPN